MECNYSRILKNLQIFIAIMSILHIVSTQINACGPLQQTDNSIQY